MRLALKEFQEIAVEELLGEALSASAEVERGRRSQALVLTSPTGSGKTVMATALMERLLRGDDENPPNPEVRFLWLTDQPALNEQTKRKLLSGSDAFDSDSLVTVEASSFNQRIFDASKVYFLNTQKLGKNSSMVERSDKRKYPLWETIATTAREYPGTFWLIIDEAHRGMHENGRERAAAQSIAQVFIKGSNGTNSPADVPPVPLLLGISATPERFNALLTGTKDRNVRPVSVAIEDVQASGLLKHSIRLYHTDEDQPSDLTLLAAATENLKEYEAQWTAYSIAEKAAQVRPMLVVQVADGTKTQLTKTNLADALAAVEGVLGPLDEDSLAHSFQEERSEVIGERPLRYIAPSEIEDDPHLRVVFFKMSLTTGWDCPRAEVMMSFRPARDDTLIAQLVGRMVRTPLARPVASKQAHIKSEFLNAVSLFLPYYDAQSLEEVVKKLSKGDPDDGLPGTDVVPGNKLVALNRNPALADAFAAADGLPTYKVERISKESGIRRLLKLGRRLGWDTVDGTPLDDRALDEFKSALVRKLDEKRESLEGDPAYQNRFKEAGLIDIRSVIATLGATTTSGETKIKRTALAANIQHAFDDAGRRLGSGLHSTYLKHRVDAETKSGKRSDVPSIKRELFVLLQDQTVLAAVESEADNLTEAHWLKHQATINLLPDEKRLEYRRIRRLGQAPNEEPLELPQRIDGLKEGSNYERHLYVQKDQTFACVLGGWEEELLAEELAREDVIGWLRNDPRKEWALSVPYKLGGEHRPMYPDFLVFRRYGSEVLCDILEPHGIYLEDSAAKVEGLAEFARKHADRFGRIEFLTKLSKGDKGFRRIALHDPAVREDFLKVSNNEHLKQLVTKL